MAATLGYNLSRQNVEASLFEIGRIFLKDTTGRLSEETHLAIGLLGPVGRTSLAKRSPVEAEEIFFWAKGILESLCAAFNAPACTLKAANASWAEPGKAARVHLAVPGGEIDIGIIGILKTSIRAEWRMTRPVALLEVKLIPLIANVFIPTEIKPLAVYPAITRDVALVVDNAVKHEDIVRIIQKSAPAELTRMDLFDIYSGKGIVDGRKSMAYSLTYRSLVKTLTDEEANELHEAVKRQMVSELKAEIRES